jgi:hypothetical protein
MALDFPTASRSEIDADLALAVEPGAGGEQRGRLTGMASIVRGGYREPISTVASLFSALRTRQLSQPVSAEPSIANRLDSTCGS